MSQAVAKFDDERFESAIMRAARDDKIDITKLQALLDMQRQVERDRSIRMFNSAMADAQADMLPVARDAMNTHTRSRYARLETIDAQMRPIYTRRGFSVRYGSDACPRDGWSRVTITIAHAGGHFEVNFLDAPLDTEGQRGNANKTPIQGVGSSVSYLRRYLLCMAFNIVLSDDIDLDNDGETGRGYGEAHQNQRATPPRDQPPQGDPRDQQPPADPLAELNGTQWLRNLKRMIEGAATLSALVEIGGHRNVLLAKKQAPLLIRQNIEDLFREAHERLAPKGDPKEPPPNDGNGEPSWPDPAAELIAEVEAMDAEALAGLGSNAAWKVKTRDLFPPDQDRLNEAIALRKANLKGSGT
jgi:hypothetical protein